MNSLVSICIPTYERPDLVYQAIESGLNQTYRPIEIIVCDDSKTDASEQMIQSLNGIDDKVVRYYRNQPALGQAGNVNRLFDLAQGDRLVLLHDDDLLMPDALKKMTDCWQTNPNLVACFGKQSIINMAGEILEERSEQLNQTYHRTEHNAGLQPSSLFTAISGQFPNDGYMVLTQAARNTRYRDRSEVSNACDFDFGLRLAETYDQFYFVNHYTALYRLTTEAVSSQNTHSHITYELIAALTVPEDVEAIRSDRLRTYASAAINEWLSIGNQAAAYKIYTSLYHPWSKRFTSRGLVQLLLIVCPQTLSIQATNRLKRRQPTIQLPTLS